MYNGSGNRESPPRYFERFQSQYVRNDARMSHWNSPPRNQDRFRSPDHYRSNSPSGGFGGSDAYNDERRFENRNQGHYSPNPPNWQYDVRSWSNSQDTFNFRKNSWSPIPGERRYRSPSAQGGYNQVRNRSPSPYGQVYSNYHQDNWDHSPEHYISRSQNRKYEGPSYQYDYSSYSPQGQGTSNYRQNSWSPSPAPVQEQQFQERNRSGSLQEPGPSSYSLENSWSPIPGERRYYRSPSPNNQQRRQSPSLQRNYQSHNVKPSLPVSGFQQPVSQLQNKRQTKSPYPNEREEETPKNVEKKPEEEEEEEPIDEEERRELYAALIREEPKRRIERSDGKWKLSITETCCDPSFLWDKSAELHLYQNIC
ncbi:hypothetical protein CRE_17527 [Caenorhabditis remanei]|uniref:Uncharacterized protein n=1 Tax=Caenorhabditis remanei TaxID=31234 RepID=E3NC29_CAERE|nr:hypothetical protein CRE_17527 [Caenorhabditis remanei]